MIVVVIATWRQLCERVEQRFTVVAVAGAARRRRVEVSNVA